MLTQTGGHGDAEGGDREVPACGCSMRGTMFSIVADGVEGQIGVVTPGAIGDLVVSRVKPLADITAFADHATALSHVVQGGNLVVQR